MRTRPRARPLALAALIALALTPLLVPVGRHADAAPSVPAAVAALAAASAPTADPFQTVRIKLTRIATVSYPIATAVRPSDGGVWLATKGGTVCRLANGSCVTAQQVASVSTGGEQGLLGIAFGPQGGRFYASYTDVNGDSRIDEFLVRGDGSPVLRSRRNIFFQDQPFANHNGGGIAFRKFDGRLYLGLGDGGSGGDPNNHAQNPGSRLGKILRINPATKQVEIWVLGLRNPWRWSFDRRTDDMWIADVGQNLWEEVNRLRNGTIHGANLGWSRYEGTHLYNASRSAPGARPPIYEYAHDPGCSVTGGYMYRGYRIPALNGAYIFADYCDGRLRGFKIPQGRVSYFRFLGPNPGNVTSFGEGLRGDLYVLTAQGGVYRVDPA